MNFKTKNRPEKTILKFTLIFIFLFFILSSFGQNISKQIKPINTIAEAKNFIEVHQNLESEIWNVNPELDNSEIDKIFLGKKIGEIFSDNENIYKIISSKMVKAYRVSYIYLDGSKISLKKINAIRKIIIKKYKSGISFSDLANEYTMDSCKNGDLGWFTEGMMVKVFEEEIKNHKLNEIFTIDIPENKWYYVTLKTFIEKEIEELTILKVRNNN